MKHLLIILSFLLLSSPLFGQSERPETIIIPVGTMGKISDSQKQIIQNTLGQELTKYFRLVPQDKFEEAQEKAFEELEFEECTEDQCIMMIQEILQVENVFSCRQLRPTCYCRSTVFGPGTLAICRCSNSFMSTCMTKLRSAVPFACYLIFNCFQKNTKLICPEFLEHFPNFPKTHTRVIT